MINEKQKQIQLGISEPTLKLSVPDSIITCHLGYPRSTFKKRKQETIKVSIISACSWWGRVAWVVIS